MFQGMAYLVVVDMSAGGEGEEALRNRYATLQCNSYTEHVMCLHGQKKRKGGYPR